MAESMFDIFGDHITRQNAKNVSRQPFSNNENMCKTVSNGPIKPNEPVKKNCDLMKPGDSKKKSFLSNTGKALQSTPLRKAFTPKAMNVGSLIYTDNEIKDATDFNFEELEFTKPKHCDYELDFLDRFIEPEILKESPPTPPPTTRQHCMEFDTSYTDEFFTDDFSYDHMTDNDDLSFDNI